MRIAAGGIVGGLLFALSGTLTAEPPAAGDDPVLAAMTQELLASVANLKGKGEEPLYYLSYRVFDSHAISLSASYGALDEGGPDDPASARDRELDVAVRVGSPKLDNTHKVRGDWSWGWGGGGRSLPVEDDVGAMRVVLWRATDSEFKDAVRQLIKVKANKAIRTEEEDKAQDFSVEPPKVDVGERLVEPIDLEAWKARCRRLSAVFKEYPFILSSSVSVTGRTGTMYFVDSDGARIREPRRYLRVMISGSVKAEDGMDLELYDNVEATTLEQLPTEELLAAKTRAVAETLDRLRVAPVVEPYTGPAIVMNRAAGVYFHEVFGHRAEGHRLKDEEEGQTFRKKVGERITPEFISVVDDPTQRRFRETVLNGYYRYDEEGRPAERVSLIEDGVLRGFLMGRTPIDGFPRSNGHGRAASGSTPCARQGNLITTSKKTMPFADLRAALIAAVKEKGKPYGMMFQEIAGGFTNTGRGMPQTFKVIPLLVYRVYPDGRPDELVRGVDLVGTPLASFEKILATGDDYAVFNGYCGAESGWVPVSSVCPSLLVGELEVEKKEKGSERVPLLPPPLHPGAKWPAPRAPPPPSADEPDDEEEMPGAKPPKRGDGASGTGKEQEVSR